MCFQIVHNPRTKIDVRMMDSFARDSYHMGVKRNFDFQRMMKLAKVLDVDGIMQVCHRDKARYHFFLKNTEILTVGVQMFLKIYLLL